MSKSILIIDTPDYCIECPLCREDRFVCKDYCCITANYILISDKPDWCPLKPIPEKLSPTGWPGDDYGDGYVDGYNACINYILGGQQ